MLNAFRKLLLWQRFLILGLVGVVAMAVPLFLVTQARANRSVWQWTGCWH